MPAIRPSDRPACQKQKACRPIIHLTTLRLFFVRHAPPTPPPSYSGAAEPPMIVARLCDASFFCGPSVAAKWREVIRMCNAAAGCYIIPIAPSHKHFVALRRVEPLQISLLTKIAFEELSHLNKLTTSPHARFSSPTPGVEVVLGQWRRGRRQVSRLRQTN